MVKVKPPYFQKAHSYISRKWQGSRAYSVEVGLGFWFLRDSLVEHRAGARRNGVPNAAIWCTIDAQRRSQASFWP